MSINYSIEKTILCSVLEHDFIPVDKKILEVKLNPDVFTNPIHKLFVKGINRLKELGDPINSDFLRERFIRGHKWDDLTHGLQLIEIMTHTPIATLDLFKKYLNVLEERHIMRKIAV